MRHTRAAHRRLRRVVDISGHFQACCITHLLQDLHAAFQTGTAKAIDTGPVGLVETRFEHDRNIKTCPQLDQCRGNLKHQSFTLDDARTGDQEQWLAPTAPNASPD